MTLASLTARAAEAATLTPTEIKAACALLLDESQPIDQRAAFLGTLHRRGETPEEIATFVDLLLQRAVHFPGSGEGCLDVCGTGGDKAGFFNTSTTTMLVAAGGAAGSITVWDTNVLRESL